MFNCPAIDSIWHSDNEFHLTCIRSWKEWKKLSHSDYVRHIYCLLDATENAIAAIVRRFDLQESEQEDDLGLFVRYECPECLQWYHFRLRSQIEEQFQ